MIDSCRKGGKYLSRGGQSFAHRCCKRVRRGLGSKIDDQLAALNWRFEPERELRNEIIAHEINSRELTGKAPFRAQSHFHVRDLRLARRETPLDFTRDLKE